MNLSASRRAWPLILAAAMAAAGGCDRNPATPAVPTGTGGELKVDIGASVTSGRAPIEITFTSNVRGGEGQYVYLWSFGDGRTSSAANPRVQFLSGGSFDVVLQVSSGHETITSGPVNVRLDSDVRLACVADPGEAIAPATVSFAAAPSGGTAAYTYRWDFGDGTSSTDRSPAHTYATPGAYREVLTVTSGGSSAVCSNVVTIYGNFHLLSCKATPMGGRAVQFHATPSFCLFNDCAYEWDFGGSGSGPGVHGARPLFTYDVGGVHTATLNASTDKGRQAASCQVTVEVP